MSPLRSSLNPMTTVDTPSRVVERSSSMPETVLTASSTGRVTLDSISSTPAPRSVVVTTTTGTSTLGNSSTPSRMYDASPSTTGPSTSMVVNTGRRMQTSQIVIAVPVVLSPGGAADGSQGWSAAQPLAGDGANPAASHPRDSP